MKKLCLIVFLLLVVCANLSAVSVDLYGAAAVKADFKKIPSDKNQPLIDSAVGGMKISVPCVDGRLYWDGSDFSYGISFNSEKLNKTFPIQAKWGKLSAGGGLSKLNNPLLTTSISPFSSATTTINPIVASLSSSFNKADTFFLQAGYKNPNRNLAFQNAVLNCFYDPNGTLFSPFGNVALSSLVSFNLPRKMKLSAEITFGSFVYDEMKSNSWYSDSAFYHAGRQNSLLSQILFSKNNFSSIFTGGFYASPFEDLKTIWKTENKIKISKSTLGLSALYNPSHNLLTSSGKTIDECAQGKLSFQYQTRKVKKVPVFWKFGCAGFYQRNLTEDIDVLKLSAGLQFLCFITSASIVGECDFSLKSPVEESVFSKGTVTLNNKWYFSAIQPGIKISAAFTPASDFSYWKTAENFVLYLSFSENPEVSLQCGAAFTQKDSENTGVKIDVSGTLKFSWKWIRCTGKFSVNLTS